MTGAPGSGSYDAVTFDMDGVIVDTAPMWESVRAEPVRKHGRGWGRGDHPFVAQRGARACLDRLESFDIDRLDEVARPGSGR